MKSPDALPSILVVDDTVENLRLLARLLGERGYEIRPVTNGRQALQAVEHDPPDLILLDINMPEMNGYEVCEKLKQKEALRDIPVIFLTAMVGTADKVKAFEAGGVDYITKPFQVEEVLARVRTHVALRRARVELGESYAQLRALEKLRDDLFHMIVHDMRSPLTVLIGSLDVMRHHLARILGPEQRSGVDEEWRAAMRGAQHLTRMTNNLLDVSRLEAGMMPIERAPADLRAIAGGVLEDMARLDRARALAIDGPEELIVSCDGALMRRVLENLVSNAIKHSPAKGRVRIELGPLDNGAGGRLAVHDEGPGVPPAARELIFEKFRTVTTRLQPYHSAGLGLTFCKLVAEAHGGTIGVDVPASGGSIFWLEIPNASRDQSASEAISVS